MIIWCTDSAVRQCYRMALASVYLSGNNFSKIGLFSQFWGLQFSSSVSFYRVQNKCVVPVVERYYDSLKVDTLNDLKEQRLVVSGDGGMDSPGHCAQYCTYTVMNQADKKLIAMEVVDKRETNLKSGLMEAKTFSRAIDSMLRGGVEVEEIVTDAHPQISAL
ncbi:hypothetical protein MAR_022873, partial [Mya arenaria]